MNRDSIMSYQHEEYHILISIHDPFDRPPLIASNSARRALLTVPFHDINQEQMHIVTQLNEVAKKKKQLLPITEEQAKKIVEFVKEHIDYVSAIVCQCDAGISRSAGLAAALAKQLNGDDALYFKNYLPNTRVYNLILKEFQK